MEVPLQEDWEALIGLLNEAFKLLGDNQMELSRQRLLEFSNTAAMLGLPDLADISTKLQEFLARNIKPEGNEEAIGTLSFAVGAFIEKMQTQTYGPEFVSGLSEVLLYLDFYGEESESPPEPAATEAIPCTAPDIAEMPSIKERPPEEPQVPEQGEGFVGQLPSDDKESRKLVEDVGTLEIPEQTTEAPPSLVQDAKSDFHAAQRQDQAVSEPQVVNDTVHVEELAPQVYAKTEPLFTPPVESAPGDEGLVVRYRMLLEIDPTSRAFVALAEELSNRGLWKEAVETCRKGLVFHPGHLRAKALLGCALWELGDTDEAESVLLDARKDLEENAILYRALAEIAKSRGEMPRAQHLQQVYETLRMADGDAQVLENGSTVEGTETESEAKPVENPPVAFLSALKTKFEEKSEDRQATQCGLFAAEDRDTLKKILTGGS